MQRVTPLLDALTRFFGGAAFPAFALAVLLLYEAGLIALTFAPPAESGFGAFAADFRAWCLLSEPGSGRVNWGYAIAMLSPPVFVAALVGWLWGAPLAAVRARPQAVAAPVLAALIVAGAGLALFLLLGPRPASGELPFPADALRTQLPPPALRLTDQSGATVDLADLRGKVVLLTGIYASCGTTCPRIMADAKRLVSGLSPAEQADLRVVAVTLDPAHDTREVLAALAEAQSMAPPVWHVVTGDSAEVERTLDRMNIARVRDPETGRIEHANLFLLVDRGGHLAYRFTLGDRQQRWLETAVRMLLREAAGA